MLKLSCVIYHCSFQFEFHGRFFSVTCVWIIELFNYGTIYRKQKGCITSFFWFSQKKTRRDKECAVFGCSNTFHNSEGTATGLFFARFLSLPSEVSCLCNLIKRQNAKDGLYVSLSTVLCHHHFMATNIKKSSLQCLK